MSKPLELTIYRPVPPCPAPSDFGYGNEDWHDSRSDERKASVAKRLTVPELLAQYWFAENMGHHPLQCAVLYRFATLPHYDEAKP